MFARLKSVALACQSGSWGNASPAQHGKTASVPYKSATVANILRSTRVNY